MATCKPINFGFSTADGELPVIHYKAGTLHFHFIDWQEKPVEFVAAGVLYFAWSDELFENGIRDDTTYEVLDSPLVVRYCEFKTVSDDETLRHFKLCFNAKGVFDVVCEGIRVI